MAIIQTFTGKGSALTYAEIDANFDNINDELISSTESITNHILDEVDAHDASAISYNGNTSLSSNNVESALDELDNEKIAIASIGVTVQPYDANTAKTNLPQTFTKGQAGAILELTDADVINVDLSQSNFFSITLAGNRTLANPTNITPGQSGCIFISQDATGSRTLSFGSFWDFSNGIAPTASTPANSVDRLDYIVRTTTSIHAVLSKAWS